MEWDISFDQGEILKNGLCGKDLELLVKPECGDLGLMCQSHYSIFNECSACFDSVASGLVNHKRNQSLLTVLNQEVHKGNKLKAEIKLLKSELKDLLKGSNTKKIDTKSSIHKVLFNQRLPNNFLDIFESAEKSMSYMLKLQILGEDPECKKCGEKMVLQGRGGFGYGFFCDSCKVKVDYKSGTFWEKSILSPNQILWLMLLWVVKARDIEISHLMEISVNYVTSITSKIRKIVAKEYLNTLPIFSGIVEVNIRNFVKRKIEIGKSKGKERWVIILVERERTLVYMEALLEKSTKEILKIIQKRCEPGTIIITETMAVYGRLENFGFPHYTVDKNKGFAHLQGTKLNISKAFGQWAWIKHAIKRYNRTSSYLNDYLWEFMWRNSMKHKFQQGDFFKGIFNSALKLVSKCRFEDVQVIRVYDDDEMEKIY